MVFHPCYYCLNSGTPSPTPYATTPEPPTCLLPQGLSLPMLPRLCPTDLSNHQIYTHRFSAYRSFTYSHCSKGKKKKNQAPWLCPRHLRSAFCLLFTSYPSHPKPICKDVPGASELAAPSAASPSLPGNAYSPFRSHLQHALVLEGSPCLSAGSGVVIGEDAPLLFLLNLQNIQATHATQQKTQQPN